MNKVAWNAQSLHLLFLLNDGKEERNKKIEIMDYGIEARVAGGDREGGKGGGARRTFSRHPSLKNKQSKNSGLIVKKLIIY